MKFPRNVSLLRSQIDMAPFAGVFFLLVIFLTLGALLPVPGLPLQIPADEDLPGTDQPSVSVAMDRFGQVYFQNQLVKETELEPRLREICGESSAPLTLVVQADKAVTYENMVRLYYVARRVGMRNVVWATRPRLTAEPIGGHAARP